MVGLVAVAGPDPAVLGRPDPVHGPDIRLGKVAGVPVTKLKSDHLFADMSHKFVTTQCKTNLWIWNKDSKKNAF